MVRRAIAALVILGSWACEGGPPPDPEPAEPRPIALVVTHEDRAWADRVGGLVDGATLAVRTRPDPIAAIDAVEDALAIGVARDEALCSECYRLEQPTGRTVVVHGGGSLGSTYGVAHALESLGMRFFHPMHTWQPGAIPEAFPAGLPTEAIEPEQEVRGLHLHTLHPIEGYFAMWEPGEENLAAADRILAWVAVNRGDFVHWSALNDVDDPGPVRDAWTAHTRTIVEHAHALGLEVGIGMQLFGASSLQQSFVLVDRTGDLGAQIDARLGAFGDIPFDAMSISFGEFSSMAPETMVGALDRTYQGIQARWPGRRVEASVHVGAGEDLRVTYMGESMPYYFLAAHATPEIVPWVHTVMYYDLFEDAGGAYLHDDFAEHRELLFELMREGRPVAYYPESAYWVAFDNTVPTYLPLYVRTRWTDFDGIREAARAGGFPELEHHVVFSSGWEWGYWQQDVACLRLGHRHLGSWEETLATLVPPWGAAIEGEVVGALADAIDAQHRGLIEQRLAPWMAGRDITLDFGAMRGDVSQPVRPSYAEIAGWDDAARAAFEADVVAALDAMTDAHEAALARLEAAGMPAGDAYAQELVDGLAIDVERLRFQEAALRAALAHGAGGDATAHLAEMDARTARARAIVDRRHEALLNPDRDVALAERRRTAGIYDFGYLRHAAQLCFWQRERIQVRELVLMETGADPGCAL